MKPKKNKNKEKTNYEIIQSYAKAFPKLGVTEDELRSYFGDYLMKKFGGWIDGQTCAISETGKICIYPCDIDNFMAMVFEGAAIPWD